MANNKNKPLCVESYGWPFFCARFRGNLTEFGRPEKLYIRQSTGYCRVVRQLLSGKLSVISAGQCYSCTNEISSCDDRRRIIRYNN